MYFVLIFFNTIMHKINPTPSKACPIPPIPDREAVKALDTDKFNTCVIPLTKNIRALKINPHDKPLKTCDAYDVLTT